MPRANEYFPKLADAHIHNQSYADKNVFAAPLAKVISAAR
jgi:hypothetical protein